MRGLDSSKLLRHRKLFARHKTAWHAAGKSALLAVGSFVLSGATLFGQALPLAACLVAALPLGSAPPVAAIGAVLGYFLRCEAATAAEYTALTILMLAAQAVFQGTKLPMLSWFMPSMAAGVSAVLGGLSVLGGGLQWSVLLMKISLCAAGTMAFRRALAGNQRAAIVLAAAVLSGLSAFSLPIDLGFLAGCALCAGSGEMTVAAMAGIALDLTGSYGQSALAALVLPSLFCRLLTKNDKALTAAAYVLMPSAVMICFDQWRVGIFTANILGAAVGLALQSYAPLGLFSRVREGANARLEQAARVLETLKQQLPEEVFSSSNSEAEEVYDAAAERVCRCCPRFHRCWEHYAAQTYEALSAAAHRIIERGLAEAEDFPLRFREQCCHIEGFVIALNQELEGMLYRRRYRMQLRESRQVVAQELSCIAAYLRAAQNEQAPLRECLFLPQVGICALAKDGISGDRGAYFSGTNGDFYVLLCDGMGTGDAAAVSSGQTVRLLQSLLRSGLAPTSALQMLNAAEILRGTGCYTTVDLLHIDLQKATARLYKWGGAASFLREDEEIRRFSAPDVPPGFGVEQKAQEYAISFQHEQMLVLSTDGADAELIESTLASYHGHSARELATLLIAAAQGDDDMTAVTVCLRPRV